MLNIDQADTGEVVYKDDTWKATYQLQKEISRLGVSQCRSSHNSHNYAFIYIWFPVI